MVQRICPSCSVVSATEKDFCPECGTKYDQTTASSTAGISDKDYTVAILLSFFLGGLGVDRF